MADPLTTAAESLAPAPASTNFFDPIAGQTVLARYAGARSLAEGAKSLAEAQTGLAQSRWDRAAQRHTMQAWDREDAEYQEKQAYKVQRGNFLKQLAKGDTLNPEDDNYLQKRAEFYSTLPMEARDDDAVAAIISAYDDQFRARQAGQERDLARQDAIAERERTFLRGQEVKAATAGLSKEEIETFRDPFTGELDYTSLMYEAGKRKSERDITQHETKLRNAAAMRQRMTGLSGDDKSRLKQAETAVVGDDKAFPSSTQSLLERVRAAETLKSKSGKAPVITDAVLKDKYFEDYTRAQQRDKFRFEFELEDARNLSEEEYVNLIGEDAPDTLKRKRAALWQYANGRGRSLTDTPAPPPAAAPQGAGATPQEPEPDVAPATKASAPASDAPAKSNQKQMTVDEWFNTVPIK
jgi:hypothetical protein